MVNTEIRLIIFAAKAREALYGQQKTRLGTDCGSDHELFTAKFRLKLKKVGKTTKPFSIIVIQIYATTTNAKEAEVEWFYKDLQDLLELIPKKDVLFIIRTGMQKSRDTWSDRQVWPWSTK